ncbi:MAG: hypothetical protein LBP68_05685 [Acidobacteriota bacterium]|nr:hypothetical protein [Acidobacteriota bacterium]
MADEIRSTDEGLKPGKKKDSCPSAKADGNTCKEFLLPHRQLKLPSYFAKTGGNTQRYLT